MVDFKRLDIYRKVPKDLTQPTTAGALVSVCCVGFITFLFLSELFYFLSVDTVSELFVDRPDREEKIPVFINITTPGLGCEFIGIDIQDDMGRHEVGHKDDTVRTPVGELNEGCRFEPSTRWIGSEFDCKLKARFEVNRVPGNFHLSTHSVRKQPDNPDMRHEIHDVTFGEGVQHKRNEQAFNALSGVVRRQGEALASHDYVIKVVPSIYEELSGRKLNAYQYTYAHKEYLAYGHGGQIMPAVWFRYDLSPITVKYTEKRKPFYTFLTTICAIIGGTFTVAGIIDGFIFTASEAFRKLEIGKLS